MDHPKLTVQSDQMFTSVKEKEREKEKKSENKKRAENSRKAKQISQAFSISTQLYDHVMVTIPVWSCWLIQWK